MIIRDKQGTMQKAQVLVTRPKDNFSIMISDVNYIERTHDMYVVGTYGKGKYYFTKNGGYNLLVGEYVTIIY